MWIRGMEENEWENVEEMAKTPCIRIFESEYLKKNA